MKPAPRRRGRQGPHHRRALARHAPVRCRSPGPAPQQRPRRETLFNWLMPVLPGARVLDAVRRHRRAGSRGGVARRGAARCWWNATQRWPRPCARRSRACRRSRTVEVVQSDALAWLARQAPASLRSGLRRPAFRRRSLASDAGRAAADLGAECMGVRRIAARPGAGAAVANGACTARAAPAKCVIALYRATRPARR